MNQRPIYVSNGSDASSPNGASGTAYFFSEALNAAGVPNTPLRLAKLSSRPLRFLKAVLGQGVSFGTRFREYYFTPGGQSVKWDRLEPRSIVIDFFQITPTQLLSDEYSVVKYIDMTLRQLFEYDQFSHIVNRDKIYGLEKLSYERADHIVCYTEYCAKDVAEHYGIDREKISVATTGANILFNQNFINVKNTASAKSVDVSMVFIGTDWRRKGLEFLNAAAQILCSRGLQARITAIGPSRDEISHLQNVDALGYVSKSDGHEAYARLIGGHDLGVIWSTQEGLPNSVLEFMSLGLPVAVADIPQLDNVVSSELDAVVPVDASPADFADKVQQWFEGARTPEYQSALVSRAKLQSWESRVTRFVEILQRQYP